MGEVLEKAACFSYALTAYEFLSNGDRLFCVATTVELPGPPYVQQGDVVRYNGSVHTAEFDASANGVSSAAQAVAVPEPGLVLQLGAGVAMLVLLGRGRMRSTRP